MPWAFQIKEVFMNDIKKAAPKLKSAELQRLIPSVIVVLVSALAIPLASNLYVNIAATALCSIYLLASAKKKVGTMLMLLFLMGTFGLPNGLPVISIILALTVGTGTFAFLISYTRSPYLAIIPMLAYSITAVITRNLLGSAFTLIFTLPALLLAIAFLKGSPRISAIVGASVAFIATGIVGVALAMLYFRGELRFDVLREYANAFKDSFTRLFADTFVELINGNIDTLFTEKEARNMALQIVTLFPAIAILTSNIVVFFAQKVQFNLSRRALGDRCITSKMLAFIVSPGAGIVFFLASMALFFTNSTPTGYAVNTVCQNLIVILTPPLIGMGVMYFFAKSALRKIRVGPLMIALIVGLLLFNFELALLFVTCYGAFASVALPLAIYMKSKSNK